MNSHFNQGNRPGLPWEPQHVGEPCFSVKQQQKVSSENSAWHSLMVARDTSEVRSK